MLSRQKRLPDPATINIHPIADDPQYQAALAELQILEERLAQIEKRRQRAVARQRGTKSPRSALARARDLIAGGQVEAVDPADDIRACDEERYQILAPAICAGTAKLDEISSELSFTASKKLAPLYAEALRSALEAMEALCAAFDATAAIRGRLRTLGFTPAAALLPPATLPAIATLDPNNTGNSAAWFWKRSLEEQGIL
jgi:hypothetical protein